MKVLLGQGGVLALCQSMAPMSVRRPAVCRMPGHLPVFFSSAQPRAACHARHTRARRVGGAATADGNVAAAPAADPVVGVRQPRARRAPARDRRELVPAKRTPDETNEKQTMIPSGIRLFVVWRSSDTRAPDASQTKASFVSSVTRRSWHVRGPNLERAGHAFVSGLACAARRHTESLQEPASGQGLAADSKEITLFPTAHLLADFTS